MKKSGFLKTPQIPQQIKDDLRRRGKKRLSKNIEVTLLRLVDKGELKRKSVKDKDEKVVWAYYS